MTRRAKNVLFVMFDQLRWDYLSCYGHPHLHTPNLDRLAGQGVRFDRAYVPAPLCGPSRMSIYTGRHVSSHGAFSNNVPLGVGEQTMGDHLRRLGMSCALVGKTHMQADREGMARLGIAPESPVGRRLAECGFDVFERDDGMRPEGPNGLYDEGGALAYNDYLRARGYDGDNPWHVYANSARAEDGAQLSGWLLGNADKPANIREEDSETPYLTRRGIDFIEQQGDAPWCCHLSYIKPHWPYIAPAPYHAMYGPEHMLPPVRSQAEFDNAHPVMKAMMTSQVGRAFSDDTTRETVLRAYMGLIKQCDDQMGVLFDHLESSGRMQDTLIVVTSDHGDFMGDHWMGEKTFFQDAASRVPLIIYDPSAEADATRGTVCNELVSLIDLLPTFIETAGGDPAELDHLLEGRSLVPFLHGTETAPRDFVVAEHDFSATPAAAKLGLSVQDARCVMLATKTHKLVHFEGGLPPMLFDLVADPDELIDLGQDPAQEETRQALYRQLFGWAMRPHQRTTLGSRAIEARRHRKTGAKGILLGYTAPEDIPEDLRPYFTRADVPDMSGTADASQAIPSGQGGVAEAGVEPRVRDR